MTFKVQITDPAMRDRLHVQLDVIRAQIAEMAAEPPGPQSPKHPHHKAVLKSARGNARDLARVISEWDKGQRAVAKRARGKGRDSARPAAERKGGDRVAERRIDKSNAKAGPRPVARRRTPRTAATKES